MEVRINFDWESLYNLVIKRMKYLKMHIIIYAVIILFLNALILYTGCLIINHILYGISTSVSILMIFICFGISGLILITIVRDFIKLIAEKKIISQCKKAKNREDALKICVDKYKDICINVDFNSLVMLYCEEKYGEKLSIATVGSRLDLFEKEGELIQSIYIKYSKTVGKEYLNVDKDGVTLYNEVLFENVYYK